MFSSNCPRVSHIRENSRESSKSSQTFYPRYTIHGRILGIFRCTEDKSVDSGYHTRYGVVGILDKFKVRRVFLPYAVDDHATRF